ncbi:MAG TPA: hypothetical protein VNA15_10805 [Candidatus Angelobacter sp.]|nr:hypothetical protein [Candidatus Angelobacter sp.]
MLSSTLGITVVGFRFIASAGSPSASKPSQLVYYWPGTVEPQPPPEQALRLLSVGEPISHRKPSFQVKRHRLLSQALIHDDTQPYPIRRIIV